MKTPAKGARASIDKIFSGFANYRLIATTDDGNCLCEVCLRANLETIEESNPGDGWHVVDIACGLSDPVQCDNCYLDASTGEAYKEEQVDEE